MTAEIKIISDFQEFRALKSEWNRLLETCATPGVWQRHEWFDCWWQAFGANSQMFVVTLTNAGRLEAILPLMIVPMRIKGVTQRALRFIENGITPRSSFLLSADAAANLALLWNEVFKHSSRWDLAVLANFEQGITAYAEWLSYLHQHKIRYVEQEDRYSPFIWLDCPSAKIRAGFGKRLRRNLSNAINRLERNGGYLLVTCTTPEEVEQGLAEAFSVSRKSWKGQMGKDMAGNKQRKAFYQCIGDTLVRQGRVRIWLLKHHDRSIAFEYALIDCDHVLLLAIDYDLDFATYSPGSVLRSLVLEELAGKELAIYDFAGTNYDYKLQWTKCVRPHSQFWIFHSGLKSRLLYQLKSRIFPALERLKAKKIPQEEAEADGDK